MGSSVAVEHKPLGFGETGQEVNRPEAAVALF